MPRLRIVLVPVALLAVVACTLPPIVPPGAKVWCAEQDAKTAADGVNAFAADLYSHLRESDDNLIVSPYSISSALAMAAVGALRGETRTELERVLHLPNAEQFGPAHRAMADGVTSYRPRSKSKASELSVANSLWLQKGYPWRKEYVDTVRGDFRAGIFDVDFADAKDASGRINRWIERETHNHIKDLVTPDALGRDTRMVLANAIYFKADWAEPFKKENTNPTDFTRANGQKVRVPIMHQQGNFWLLEGQGFQVLRLPYAGKATSMYVLLPQAADGLPALEQQLNAENLANWTTDRLKAPPQEVRVWLPKFKFTVPTELAGVLSRMGLSTAFDVQKANFRGISDHPEGLYLNRVIHQAFVELDETGTEAAAATAVVAIAGSITPVQERRVKEFRADHPFVFVIKHEPTGAMLFVGRVTNPTR